jgi:hypothetical protein
MDRKDSVTWNLLESMELYLNNHTCAQLYELIEIAISEKARVIIDSAAEESKDNGDMWLVIDWASEHIIPESTNRHNKLFKNIAIWLVNNNFSERAVKKIDERIIANCPGKKSGEIVGWMDWAKQKKREVNMLEVEDVAALARS